MFETLLLAVDINDPDGSKRSTEAAIRLASQEQALLHVVNVVPDDGMAIVSASLKPEQGADTMSAAKAALADWAGSKLPDGIETKLHVVRGTVYDQILKLAKQLDVGAIVVGAHRPALKDYLIGPNAARVARHADQSVFVIR